MSLKTKELKDVASVSQSDSSTSIVVPNFITDNKKIDNSSNSSQSVTVTDQRVESLDSSSNALLAYFRQYIKKEIIMDLDFAAQLMKLWPVFLGFITLVIVLAKMHATIQVLEEKVKVAFQLINKLSDRK